LSGSLEIRDEFLQIVGRQVLARNQHQRHLREQATGVKSVAAL
jgi:hypothetical protein